MPGPLRTASYPIAHSVGNRDTLSFAFKGFLKVQPPVKAGSEFVIIKAALLGRKGLFRTVLFGVTKNALGNFFSNGKEFCVFTCLYGTHRTSSYKYRATVAPAKVVFNPHGRGT